MRNIIVFAKLTRVRRYKLKTALWLAAVPVAITALVFGILMIFIKVNIYHIESLGGLINEDVRGGYYDQIIGHLDEILPQIGLLFVSVFIVAYMVMRWAASPFERARIYIERTILSQRAERASYDFSVSEDPVFEQLVRDFCEQIQTGSSVQARVSVESRPLNLRFLFKYIVTFGVVSVLVGLSLTSIFLLAYDKIVSISLQLIPGKSLSGHYFTAQQEILGDALNASIFFGLLVYAWIGWKIHKYMRLNLFVFSKAISERRFPVALKRREIYYALAEALNRAYAKHKQNRI